MPFYPNEDEFHCINAAMQSALRFYQRKDYSVNFIDCFLRRKPRTWPWMPECVLVLHELGLKVRYFARINMMDYLKGDSFIKKITGVNHYNYTKRTDYERLIKAVYRLKTLELFEQRELSLDEVSRFMNKGYTPLFVINNIFVNPNPRIGKYVVVTKIDGEHVYYHETGPKIKHPNYKVLREEFMKAWFNTRELVLIMGNQKLCPMK